jgi:hypothetical protein
MGKEIVLFSNLVKALDDELAWRRKELHILKGQIPKENNALQSAMLRCALPLLYAHWEGFIKLSMSYYLEHVSRKYLKHSELTTKFITLSLQNKIGDLSENSFEKRTKIVELLFSEYYKRSNIPHKNIIQTKSNLRFEVLEEILFILELNDDHIESKKSLIDDLVNTRNHIAHGQKNLLDYQTFEIFHTDIIALMIYIKTKIENNAIQELYKASTPYIELPI